MKHHYAIYDSPITHAREAWIDGVLLWSVTLLSMLQRGGAYDLPMPRPWREGYIKGDPRAIPPRWLAQNALGHP